jgi:hypothetical protein
VKDVHCIDAEVLLTLMPYFYCSSH